jgi:hypothetical protein
VISCALQNVGTTSFVRPFDFEDIGQVSFELHNKESSFSMRTKTKLAINSGIYSISDSMEKDSEMDTNLLADKQT